MNSVQVTSTQELQQLFSKAANPANNPTGSLRFFEGSELQMDINNSGAETIISKFSQIADNASLRLDVDMSDISSLPEFVELPIITAPDILGSNTDEVTGQFSTIVYGEASYDDFFNANRALAVLYDGDLIGEINQQQEIDGVSVVVTLPGDFNVDGRVGDADLTIMQANWGSTGMTWTGGDVNGNGSVGDAELTAILQFWVQSILPGGGSSVPEPSSFVLVLATMVVLGFKSRQCC